MPAELPTVMRWEASDGYPLMVRLWEPVGPVRGYLVALHGIQSHGGWYEWSCSELANAGFAVHFLDRRGCGLNWLRRGDAPSYRRLVADVVEYVRELKANAAEPAFLWAGSWGAKVATAAAAQVGDDLNGLALWCPGFCPKVSPSFAEKLRIVLARLTRPQRRFRIPLNDPRLFTANPERQRFIAEDPLALTHATARMLIESVRLDRHLRSIFQQLRVPKLLLLAGRDRIIDNARTRVLVESWPDPPLLLEYADVEHTLEFEPRPQRFVSDLLEWLAGLLPPA